MGGNLGCHRSIPRDPTDFCQNKRKFSAACNFSHILVNQERLNINTSTEEELMTLPGVNRAVARNIVEYRECIGGFKKVEDLALVSGVGAAKLEAIKLEICVSSRTSSSQHSPSSLRREHDHLPGTGMNINTATPAQLMSIRGITEKIARNIVDYRTANGPFKSIEDLVKVNHINSSLLDRIRFLVFVERSRTPSTNTNGGLTGTNRSHPSPTSLSLRSEDLDLPPGGPTQIISVRPSAEPLPSTREGRPVVRVATWNLQRCSREKANNPGVKEVVCMTLLENDIKLLAVQDLADQDALEKFCVELNQATLPSVRRWRGPRGVWRCLTSESQSPKASEFSGFLWDYSSGIELRDTVRLGSPVANGNGKPAPPRPFLARFNIGSLEVMVANVHLTGLPSPPETASGKSRHGDRAGLRLTEDLQETLKGEKTLLLLGDFGLPPDSGELEVLRKEKMAALLPPSLHTNISTRSPLGSHCLDNLWASRCLKKIYSGHCWVVREGLTNPWIPDNWSWGGVASDHCPVVAEFYTDTVAKETARTGVAVVERCETPSKNER
ncbi:endonuclease/exonuclease/phosphatase family domain-containing protein 1-like [Conger conger]|uniref:endonuclease/exonuclease/phosphatase family domain-containing protein 1-like n=1 Tax=Conger conger TaxID=82655 RepID=UPI002A5A7EA3|nr:endonuclease/exonuclease/phosphatase family domain-containing protein 1-like [Conger conger]XP_061112182.1 endonuclease/exonuclease/phosphatase family domain-containing protein 1-like [Conger conger]XP_061112183.1 endonuclease/exonuclease/phosphatase family domain-containing protein 1-like [Conger conger]